MMDEAIEPLDAVLWFRRIQMIANGELSCLENSLRHASHLVLLAPAPFRQHVGLAIDEQRFEALLESGDFDTAARHLVAPAGALSIGRTADATALEATIRCPVLKCAVVGRGETVANAVIDAWTAHLLALRGHFETAATIPSSDSVVVFPTGLRRKARRLVH